MAFGASRTQIGYVQKETTWGVIPNTGGTATLAGGDAFLLTSLEMNLPANTLAQRPDKARTYSRLVGTQLRKVGSTFTASMSVAPSGSAGTPPDIDPFLQALFGKAPTVVAATSVTYGLEDADPSIAIWDFIQPGSMEQRVMSGAIVQRGSISLGQDFATFEFSGEGKWVLSKDGFASASTEEKSGLTAFPSEPASPVVTGSALPGHRGTVTLDGQTYTTFREGTVEIAVARALDRRVWNSDLPGPPTGGDRDVTGNITLTDDDSANLRALKAKAGTSQTVAIVLTCGTIAGSIMTINLNNVILNPPQYGYGDTQRTVSFAFQAHASSLTAKDEITIVFT